MASGGCGFVKLDPCKALTVLPLYEQAKVCQMEVKIYRPIIEFCLVSYKELMKQ